MSVIYGIDVGGSGIKGAPVDMADGQLTKKRTRIATPRKSTPRAVLDVIDELLDGDEWRGPLGVAIPAVVVDGVAMTAANIDDKWIGTDVAAALKRRRGREVVVVNDADAAGLAEVRYGAGREASGVVMLLTFGTGVGSAVFVDGTLVPNTELGHLEFRGAAAELSIAARLVDDNELSLKKWTKRVNDYLGLVERVFSPQRIIFGGGISKRFEDYSRWLDTSCDVVPAKLRNRAGIVGAAVAAAVGKDGS